MELLITTEDEAWRVEAACAGLTSEDFFLVGDDLEGMRKAQQVCAACPVKNECLEFALASNQSLGIWGGTTPNERRKLRRVWRQKAS